MIRFRKEGQPIKNGLNITNLQGLGGGFVLHFRLGKFVYRFRYRKIDKKIFSSFEKWV